MIVNRTIAPAIQQIQNVNFPKVEKTILRNDVPLYTVEGCSEPIIKFDLFFQAGRFFESQQHLAALTGSMLNKGTLTKNSFEIAKAIDFVGAHLHISANMYTASLSVSCLTEHLEEILAIVQDIMLNPTFPEEELETLKQRTIQKWKVNQQKNSYVASKHFSAALFGENHACGYLTIPSAIEAVSREDVVAYYKSNYKFGAKSFVLAGGDISQKEIELFNQYLSPISKTTIIENDTPFLSLPQKDINITVPDSVQASIRVGDLMFGTKHPDYKAFGVLNTVFGGYFGSRLMSNIREEKGYTYGIYSFNSPIIDKGYFCISTDVGSQYKEATLEEISKEILRLQQEPIPQEELEMVKNYMIGQIMKSVDGALKMASTVQQFLIFGLDFDEINKDVAAIQQVDAKRLQDLANQYLDFDKMYKVVAS